MFESITERVERVQTSNAAGGFFWHVCQDGYPAGIQGYRLHGKASQTIDPKAFEARFSSAALAWFLEALKDKDLETRLASVEMLGIIGDTRAVEPLLAAYLEEDVEYCYRITDALTRIVVPDWWNWFQTQMSQRPALAAKYREVEKFRDFCERQI